MFKHIFSSPNINLYNGTFYSTCTAKGFIIKTINEFLCVFYFYFICLIFYRYANNFVILNSFSQDNQVVNILLWYCGSTNWRSSWAPKTGLVLSLHPVQSNYSHREETWQRLFLAEQADWIKQQVRCSALFWIKGTLKNVPKLQPWFSKSWDVV